ncbi:Platelet endothelial cell adhesion molecule [Varanus komodoensis]|nr:Platelet endothelial cell adhesion molecule [Varanus komodoensis]
MYAERGQAGCKLKAQDNVFTINNIILRADPSEQVENGKPVTLYCTVDISKSEHFQLNYTFSFSRNDKFLFNKTSERNQIEYIIHRARFSDSGNYECTLNVEGKTKSSQPLTIKVKGIRQPKLTVQKTEVQEGEKVFLRCEVPEETPPFHFIFYKIPQSQHMQTKEKIRGPENKNFAEIEFLIDVGDRILYFECVVQILTVSGNERSNPSNKTMVTVHEPFSKPEINIQPPQNITEGDQMCVECKTVLLRPDQIEIIIQKDRTILNSTKGRETVKYCKVVTKEDHGEYICKAELSSVSKTGTVNVNISELFSKPKLILQKRHLDENSLLKIQCQADGPEQIHFSLLQDNKVLVNSSVYNTTAHVGDSGSYICKAKVKGITKKSEPIQVYVYAPVSRPVLSRPVPQVIVLGKYFQLKCRSDRGTLPITYILYRGNVPVGNQTVTEKNISALFQVKATSMEDPGEYRCSAQNGHSIMQKSIGHNITVIAPVADINLGGIQEGDVEDGQELTLLCTVGSGSFPINFSFFKENSAKSLYQITQSEKRGAIWYREGITKQDGGKYYCRADNQAKSPLLSKIVTVNVVLASWKKWLISTIVLLLLLALGIAVLVRYCFKKKKAKGSSMELARSKPEKLTSVQNNEGEFYYGSGYNEDGETNHIKSKEDNKDGNAVESQQVRTEIFGQLGITLPLKHQVHSLRVLLDCGYLGAQVAIIGRTALYLLRLVYQLLPYLDARGPTLIIMLSSLPD